MRFKEVIEKYSWEDVGRMIEEKTPQDVENALLSDQKGFQDLLALLSPAAGNFLEDMAQLAHENTVKRFGRTINLYAPLYLSSYCVNSCVYCGFNRNNVIKRARLTKDEALAEARFLHAKGFRSLLLVTGESNQYVTIGYLKDVAEGLRKLFASLAVEIYPVDRESYSSLIESGIDGLTIYQETYDKKCYKIVHPSGPKRDYYWRLDTLDRGGEAGFRRLNLGALLGLSPWRIEGAFVGLHAGYLTRKYWQSHVSVSFPRLREAKGGYKPAYPVKDRALVQLICAMRLWLPDSGLVLSTREPQALRDNLVPLGITSMSAGSKTAPGGYSSIGDSDGQFMVNDHRTPEEVASMIESRGYEAVWKDWDAAFLNG